MGVETPVAKIEGTVLFSVVGRTHYGFDIFSVHLPSSCVPSGRVSDNRHLVETKLTDGVSVNFNGCFALDSGEKSAEDSLVYVSERTGSSRIFIEGEKGVSEAEPIKGVVALSGGKAPDLFYDRPSLIGRKVYFVSTQQPAESLRQSWAAVYVTDLDTGHSVRLTPRGVVDFSPSLSPSGKWAAVASYADRGWDGEVDELHTDIWIFNAEDGSQRRLVVKNGGWPSWADESTIFFHRRSEDGWWSIYKASIPEEEEGAGGGEAERVTPPCVHAFTPAASQTGEWVAVATRRPESKYRQVEIFHLGRGEFEAVTERANPEQHHYNPFISARTGRLGYHRCRDLGEAGEGVGTLRAPQVARLERMVCPAGGLTMVRVDGFFPSLSPCGRYIAFNLSVTSQGTLGLFVMRSDGSKAWKVSGERSFQTSWDPQRPGVVYTSVGRSFAPGHFAVQVAAVHFDLASLTDDVDSVPSHVQLLTIPGTGNNAFPAPSPDGRQIVFRSGRDGAKNLYIMDAVKGEAGAIRRLTNGNWTDTMPAWSPDGQLIAFSSSRAADDDENFALYMVRPDGEDLRQILPKSSQHQLGRINHVSFSPDGRSIVFTADLAGVSAEPISLPNQFQPYGDVFLSRLDGSELIRLTHNAYENGTPVWTSAVIVPSAGSEPLSGDFAEPFWLSQITEEMKSACC